MSVASKCNIPEDQLNELILLMDSIVVSWIDQAFGYNAVQLSLSSRANYAFAEPNQHATLNKYDENQSVESRNDSEINASDASRHIEP